MITSEKIDKILPALVKVKNDLQAVTKSAKNPFFKSNYADLNTYLNEVEPLLETNGLILLQPTVSDQAGNRVVTRIYHADTGQYVESSMKLVGETDMQKAGSGVTYARRYTLGALLSMQAEDDDGNTVSGKTFNKTAKTTTTPAPVKAEVTNGTTTPKDAPKVTSTATTEEPAIKAAPANKPSFRDRYKNQKTEAPKAAPAPTQAAPATVESNGDDL